MNTAYLLSLKLDFALKSKKEQDRLIKIDVFNLLVRFVHGNISEETLKIMLQLLSTKGSKTKEELFTFIKTRASYEAYQASLGKNRSELLLIKERLFIIIE